MTAQEYSDLLAALVGQAANLRRAGVKSVSLGEMKVELTPAEDERPRESTQEELYGDPIDDPATFLGGRMPTYGRGNRS